MKNFKVNESALLSLLLDAEKVEKYKSYKTKKDNESLPDSFTLDLPMNVLN